MVNDIIPFTALRELAIPSCNNRMTLQGLVGYLKEHHHLSTRQKLSGLNHRLQHLLRANTQTTVDLLQVYQSFNGFREMFEQHLNKEESILFPFVEDAWKISLNGKADALPQEALLASPLRIFRAEHLSLLAQLQRIREACGNLSLEASGSLALERLLPMFLTLEKDLREHVYLQNNLLYPGLLGLGRQIKVRPGKARLAKLMA